MAALALIGAGCGGANGASGGTGAGGSGVMPCVTDEQCNDGSACVSGICVDPSPALVAMAMEILPTPTSAARAGLTELASVNLSGRVQLELPVVEAVSLEFIGTTTAPVPIPAGIVYTLPSSIPRRPALTFETDLVDDSNPVLLPLSATLSSLPATVRLIPRPGADHDIPPFWFTAGPGDPKTFSIPSDRFAIRGSLRDAAGKPPGPFVARAYQNGLLVSNRDEFPEGDFLLIIPAAAAASAVSVQLVPVTSARPWFQFEPFIPNQLTATNSVHLGTVNLAAYVVDRDTEGVQIIAVGDETDRSPVANAFVRAATTLETAATTTPGATRFQLDAVTDAQGSATLKLLTGTAQSPRFYDIRIFPDANSVYASACMTMVPVTNPGRFPDVPLRRRPMRTGRLLSARGMPVASATVVATRPPPTLTECASPIQLSTTTHTDTNGLFTLNLDPGTYQIDYIPPAGSAAPRRTDYDVEVSDATLAMDVFLPAGALVQGQVRDSSSMEPLHLPLVNARISIFDATCNSLPCLLPPRLLAETYTDADGLFRAVVAVP
jgi:hypothetical protein